MVSVCVECRSPRDILIFQNCIQFWKHDPLLQSFGMYDTELIHTTVNSIKLNEKHRSEPEM